MSALFPIAVRHCEWHVRFGSISDIPICPGDIRFTFELKCYPKLGARGADMFTLMDSASAAFRSVRNIVNPKAEPTAPETVRRIPRKQFDAVMGGAKAVMRELTEFAEQAKSRLREDRPIKQDDLAELLRK